MSLDPPPLETLALKCPHCGGVFQVRAGLRGQDVACPHCQHEIEVPRASTVVPPPPPPPREVPPAEPPREPSSAAVIPPLAPLAEPGLTAKDETPAAPAKPASKEPEPPRELTREERERLRRRFRLIVALFAGTVLLVALLVLLRQ